MNNPCTRFKLVGAVALALMIGAASEGRAITPDAAKHGPIPWIESLDKAKKTAAKQKKIIMVDFWAEWCIPCKQMLDTTYKDKAVVQKAKQFVPALIDFDKNKALVRQYRIETIPLVIFMDARGKVLVRSLGKKSASELLKLMDEASKKSKS